jgi:integration host factor subunit alpha
MSKKKVIDKAYEILQDQKQKFRKQDVKLIIDATFDAMKQLLLAGEEINLYTFGVFCIRMSKERMGRNPQTGKEMILHPKRSLKFRVAKEFQVAMRNQA